MSDEFAEPLDLSRAEFLERLRAMSPEEQARVLEDAKEIRLALLAMLLDMEGRE